VRRERVKGEGVSALGDREHRSTRRIVMIPPRGKVEPRREWKKNMRNRRRRQEGQQEYRGDREQKRVRCLRKRRIGRYQRGEVRTTCQDLFDSCPKVARR
jgi:hypothetical protein